MWIKLLFEKNIELRGDREVNDISKTQENIDNEVNDDIHIELQEQNEWF